MSVPVPFALKDENGQVYKDMKSLRDSIGKTAVVCYDDDLYVANKGGMFGPTAWGESSAGWIWTTREHAAKFEIQKSFYNDVKLKWPTNSNVFFVVSSDNSPNVWFQGTNDEVNLSGAPPSDFFLSGNPVNKRGKQNWMAHPNNLRDRPPDESAWPWKDQGAVRQPWRWFIGDYYSQQCKYPPTRQETGDCWSDWCGHQYKATEIPGGGVSGQSHKCANTRSMGCPQFGKSASTPSLKEDGKLEYTRFVDRGGGGVTQYTCPYEVTRLMPADMPKWRDKFTKNGVSWRGTTHNDDLAFDEGTYNELFRRMCFGRAAKGDKTRPLYMEDSQCQIWGASKSGAPVADAEMRKFCARTENVQSEVCSCINAARGKHSKTYGTVNSEYTQVFGPKVCWFSPCGDARNHLVPKDVLDQRSVCKSPKCVNVVSISGYAKVDHSVIKPTATCNTTKQAPPNPPPGQAPSSKKPPEPNHPPRPPDPEGPLARAKTYFAALPEKFPPLLSAVRRRDWNAVGDWFKQNRSLAIVVLALFCLVAVSCV